MGVKGMENLALQGGAFLLALGISLGLLTLIAPGAVLFIIGLAVLFTMMSKNSTETT